MKYLIVTVIILLVASGGWSLSCKVCDEGEKKREDQDSFEDIPADKQKHFLMEDLCKDDTPQTTCDDDNELCVTWEMEFRSDNYQDYSLHDVTMNQYRCEKENDVKKKAHCDVFLKWHMNLYDERRTDYYHPYIKKCKAEITKRGKFA